MAEENQKIEFNSMVAVLQRLNQITYGINDARVNRHLPGMLDGLIDYFKEIAPELNSNEMEIWQEIQKLRRLIPTAQSVDTPPHPQHLVMLDDIDIKLRCLAKKHGFLTKTEKGRGDSIIT